MGSLQWHYQGSGYGGLSVDNSLFYVLQDWVLSIQMKPKSRASTVDLSVGLNAHKITKHIMNAQDNSDILTLLPLPRKVRSSQWSTLAV